MQKLLESIAVTAELMGSEISPTSAAVMASDLSEYPQVLVIEALSHIRKESKSRLSLALVIEKIEELTPGGRPSPEEAWALIPKDEQSSAVMSNEMAQALGIAQSLIDEGDMVAARMAFKESYTNIVKFNKMHGIKVEWFPSLGYDSEGRTQALADAVRKHRLTADHALRLVSPHKQEEFVQLAGIKNLALGNRKMEAERDNINRVKMLLSEVNKNA
jgi:hypothetical protein